MIGACKFLIIIFLQYAFSDRIGCVFFSRFESMMIELCETCILGKCGPGFQLFSPYALEKVILWT